VASNDTGIIVIDCGIGPVWHQPIHFLLEIAQHAPRFLTHHVHGIDLLNTRVDYNDCLVPINLGMQIRVSTKINFLQFLVASASAWGHDTQEISTG
jgi:hypothetical protein